MAYDIRMFKLVTGELVIGKFDEENDRVADAAVLQTLPTQQGGVQMLLMPYGYPFENEFCGAVSGAFFLYRYKKTPDDLRNKYLEAVTNLTLSGGGLGAAVKGSGLISGLGGPLK